MSNSPLTIVVFEARPRWEPELQRQFANEAARVRGCRAWPELSKHAFRSPLSTDAVQPAPPDVIVLDVPLDAAACLQWLGAASSKPLLTPCVIALCPEPLSALEWTLRDVGVRQVIVGHLTGERLAKCCRQCVQTTSSTAIVRARS